MENAEVYQDTVSRLLTKCREVFGETYSYYDGDPIEIPRNNLPCIIVEKVNGDITLNNAPTGHDRFIETISVKMCLDKQDDAGASDKDDLTERKLRRAVEARHPITRTYLDDTLMAVVRRHLTLDDYTFNADVAIDYDVNPRSDMVVTSEGRITVTGTGLIPVPDRN